ncbi:MAG TPA: hypothetical protein VF576_07420, partial [Rubricoccaceae bacterium]
DRRARWLALVSQRFSRSRLALAGVGGLTALVVGNVVRSDYGWIVALATTGAFAVLARRHEKVEQARVRLARWRLIQARHLARLQLDWDVLPPPSGPPPPGHPFAADLDLAGPRSVLHLIDATASEGGSACLRDWVLALIPDPEAVRQRQARVRALVQERRFRDRLGLLGLEAAGRQVRWSDGPVRAWIGGDPADRAVRRWATGLSALAATTVLLVGLDLAGGPALWSYSFFLYLALYGSRYRAFAAVFDRAYDLQRAIAEVEPVLAFLEASPLGHREPLAPVWAPFRGPDRPSVHYTHLGRIAAAAAVSRSDVGRIVLNGLLPYDLLLTLALGRLRERLRAVAPAWLAAYTEIEALASLAADADLHAGSVSFPDLVAPSDGAPLVEAEALGHPLLPSAVRNSVTLDVGGVLVLTGSNMAGKSTFLRALGVAAALGWAGGPVAAGRLRLTPLRPFASMRVGDVLQEGLSTFYAEVRRLRLLLDAVETAGAPPVLVLIDEMYRGTNNRERLAGARAFVRALSGAPATSLVATHDLALADLAGEIPEVRNAHFREVVDGDALRFDYRLRPRPCPTTNALVIMERAGLPVEAPRMERAS